MMIVAFVGYIAMYRLYGQFIGKRIFALPPEATVPSVAMEDGTDYVPTEKEIIFGHHFTSIAGTGSIVGPAIAIIWGWVPALLWVFVGSIVMGAVHDFGALIISMRNQGKSISDFTEKYINNRTRFLLFLIVFLELWIVIAVFGLVIVITIYLKSRGGLKWMVAGIPAVFMAVMTIWASLMNQAAFGNANNLLLQIINVATIIIACWIVLEGVV